MKGIFRRGMWAGLALAVVLGAWVHVRETPVRAQGAGTASTPEAQSPAKNQQEQDENDAYLHSPTVAKLGGMMGMNATQAANAFEVTNFLMLAVLVGWLLVKMLPGQVRARNSSIQKSLVDARTATQEASARLSAVEERLTRLDGEIAAMRDRAQQDAAGEEARFRAAVEEEKKSIVAAAEREIASATTHAQKALQQFAAELAIQQAARKLVVSAETDRLLVQSFAKRLAGDESKKGQN